MRNSGLHLKGLSSSCLSAHNWSPKNQKEFIFRGGIFWRLTQDHEDMAEQRLQLNSQIHTPLLTENIFSFQISLLGVFFPHEALVLIKVSLCLEVSSVPEALLKSTCSHKKLQFLGLSILQQNIPNLSKNSQQLLSLKHFAYWYMEMPAKLYLYVKHSRKSIQFKQRDIY